MCTAYASHLTSNDGFWVQSSLSVYYCGFESNSSELSKSEQIGLYIHVSIAVADYS